MREKRQSFVHGAAILAIAGIVVKVIGACYKIPLGSLLGPVGMADFSIAYNIYALLFVLSTAGVPAAVSKMVSEAYASGDSGGIYKIYKVSYLTFAFVGFLGFAFMFVGAEQLALFMGSADAAASIKAISPAVLFVSMSAINRGYFQGRSNMYPTAISEVIEALGKLVIGLAAAWYLKKTGEGEGTVSVGAVFGVTAGAFLSALHFAFCRDDLRTLKAGSRKSGRHILKELMLLAIPITMGAAVISLTNVIDSALVMNLLQGNGFSEYRAKWLYGAYTYASTVFNLPSAIITTLAVSLIPALSAAFARHEHIRADKTINAGLRITAMIAVPAACGLGALAYGVLDLLYGASVDAECIKASSKMLLCLAVAIPPLALVTVTNAVHQSLGRAHIPVISMLAGATVKIVSNLVLVAKPDINIYGAPVSTVLCYITIAVLNIAAFKKYPFVEISITKIFGKPALMGGAAFIAARLFENLTKSTFAPHICTVLSVFVGVFVCAACAFFVGAVGEEEKKLILGDKKIFKFLNND